MTAETSLSEVNRERNQIAIQISDAFKKYSSKGLVLRGLNMTVFQGTIYGLLGPSGCGKTTLLSCLIGRRKLDSGCITLKINRKSQIGYMPQDIALFQEFSIKEHMMFYGLINSMERGDIMNEAHKLMQFLELPNMDTIVSALSGGQQRRVSLCIALLHKPEVLILDEPTVGVDLVLSESIWDKLVELSKDQGSTVVVTTHYIQEARRSNTIGLMRNGKILAQSNPETLMREHDCVSLEEVFLKLCRHEVILNNCSDDEESDERAVPPLEPKSLYSLFESSNLECNRVVAYSMKSFIWMKRNIALVLFTLLLPIVQCTLISITVGDDPRGIVLGVVNEEVVNSTSGNSTKTANHTAPNCSCSSLSLEYLSLLQAKGVYLKDYIDLDDALKAVKKNQVWGALYFNANYSKYVSERLAYGVHASDTAINGSEVIVWLDLSNDIIGRTMKSTIQGTALDLIANVIIRCNFSTMSPGTLGKEESIYGNVQPSFRQFMTPANAVLFAFYLPMMFTLGAMLMEKTSGLLERGLVAGLTLLEIAIGHILLQTFILLAQTVLMMVVLYCVFENPIVGQNVFWCVLFLLLVGICGMFYGFFVAALCDSFTAASCLAIGSYFPLFMLSGAIWPLEGMHYILRVASIFLPITPSVEAYRSISIRSWPITYHQIYISLISLVVWTTVFAVLTAVMAKCRGMKS